MPNNTNITPVDFNFTYWHQHLTEFVLWGYIRSMGVFFFPVLVTGIITYIYLKNQSAVSAVVGILIIFSCFAGTALFSGLPALVLLFQVLTCMGMAGLITYFFTKRRQ